jgi:RNA polymerase sigma-70 factor, ECF subfamily
MDAPQADRRPESTRLQTADIERLYRVIGPKLHQFIRRQVPEPAMAADLLQDVFVRLIRAEVDIRSDGEMRSYLYRTATSVIAEYYRVAKLRRMVPFVPEQIESEPAMQVHDDTGDARQLKMQIDRGFSQLAVRDRTLLWLAYVEEMNHVEIGAAVGLGTASVKVMLFRARQRLAAALREMGLSPEELQ